MIVIHTLHRTLRFPHERVRRLVQVVARGEGVSVRDVSVVLMGDRRMKALHARHLNHPWTTDVLSFMYEGTPDIEGEIVVNLDQARRQAPTFGATYRSEASRLVVHGMLHLVGYDDRTDAQRQRMHVLEDRYLLRVT